MADSVNTAGSLKFDTKIDTSGFERGTTDLKRSMERFKSSLKGVSMAMDGAFGGPSSKVIDLGNKIRQTERELENLQVEMEKIQNTPYVSTAFEDMQRQVDRTEAKMRELLNQRELLENNTRAEFVSLGFKDTHAEEALKANPEWKKLSSQIDQAEQSLTRYEAQLEQIRRLDAGTDVKETADYRKRAEEYQKLADKLDVYKARLGEVQRAEQKASKGSRGLGSSMKKASGDSKKLNRSMNSTKKSASGLSKTLGMLKMSIIMSFAFRGIQAAMNGVTDGLQNLSQYSKPVNADMSALMSSMTQLKNAFATAFAPILSVVVPALNSLISVLVSACNAVGQFFAALTGHTTFTKSVKVQEDYAASLKKTGSAAKQAGKDAERSLMGFDAINKLSDNKAASGGGYEGPQPGDMFETVEINPKVLEAVEKFKNVLQKLKKAAQPTVDALKRLKKALEPLEKFAVQALLDFYNDFLKPVGKWTLGKGLPRLADATAKLVKGIDWKNLNRSLKDFWKQLSKLTIFAFDSLIDFYEDFLVPIGKWTLSKKGLPALVDVVSNLLSAIDWDRLNDALDHLWQALAPFATAVGTGFIMFVKSLSNILKPVLSATVDGLSTALDALATIIEAIPEDVAIAIGGAIGGIAMAILLFKGATAVAGIIVKIKAAISGLLTAIAAHPYVAIAAGIAALAGAIMSLIENAYESSELGQYAKHIDEVCESADKLCEEIDSNIESRKEELESIEAEYGAVDLLAGKYFELADKEKLSKKEKKLLIEYGQQLIKKIPELKGLIDEETGAYKGTREQIEALIEKTKEYYMVQAAQEQLTEIARDLYNLENGTKEVLREKTELQKKLTEAQKRYNELKNEDPIEFDYYGVAKVNDEIKLYKESLNELDGKLQENAAEQRRLNKEWDDAEDCISSYQAKMDSLNYANLTLESAKAIDEMHGVWKNGEQVLGKDAVAIYDEIMAGLEPLPDGSYKLANGAVVKFGKGFSDGKPKAKSTVDSLVKDIDAALGSLGKVGKENGEYLIKSTNDGIKNNQQSSYRAAMGLGDLIARGLNEALEIKGEGGSGKAKKAGKNTTAGFNAGISKTASDAAIKTWATAINIAFCGVMGIHSPSAKFKEFGKNTVSGFNNGVADKRDTSKGYVETWASHIMRDFKAYLGIHSPSTVFAGYGKNVVEGLNSGISSNKSSTGGVIGKWVSSIKDWFTQTLNIHSPSRVFKDFGEYVVEGFNSGILDNLNSTKAVFKDWSDTMTANPTVSLPKMPHYKPVVPALATGAVIPRNVSYAAAQSGGTGNVNVNIPVDLLAQAFRQALRDEAIIKLHLTSNSVIDQRVVGKSVVDYVNNIYKMTGDLPFRC